MEIDIPDLDDVEFVKNCYACYGSGFLSGPKGQVDCWRCVGKKIELTPVGERLIDFLTKVGVLFNKDGWRL
jgi:hypothetical protein